MYLPLWIKCSGRPIEGKTQEWVFFRKDIRLSSSVSYARVRFLSSGVCGLWINGNFVEAATARYPGRVNSHEVTSFTRKGRNVIALQCGSSYFWASSGNCDTSIISARILSLARANWSAACTILGQYGQVRVTKTLR